MYTPTKGSPKPALPGNNIVETLLEKAETLIEQLPTTLAPQVALAQEIVTLANAAIIAVDPYGQKGTERTQMCVDAETKAQSADQPTHDQGIAEAVAFAQDVPAHPVAWERRMRWICVNYGAPDPKPGGP